MPLSHSFRIINYPMALSSSFPRCMVTRQMIHMWTHGSGMVHSAGNTISFCSSGRKSDRVRTSAPLLRRIITHAAPCATAVEAETTELIEDIVYRYFSTLAVRRGMHQRYAIILRRRRVCRDDATRRDAT